MNTGKSENCLIVKRWKKKRKLSFSFFAHYVGSKVSSVLLLDVHSTVLLDYFSSYLDHYFPLTTCSSFFSLSLSLSLSFFLSFSLSLSLFIFLSLCLSYTLSLSLSLSSFDHFHQNWFDPVNCNILLHTGWRTVEWCMRCFSYHMWG